MDDSQIVELFWQRSEHVVSAAQEAYEPMCRYLAGNLLTDPEDVQECINDTWYALWDSIPPQRPTHLRAYIAQTTRNLAMKRLRHQKVAKRNAVTVSFEELGHCIPDAKTVEQVLEGKELARVLDRFLDTLAPEDRNLFLRRYWFFDSVRQLAHRFDMSQSHVSVKLFRIREKLKDYLEKEADIYVR